MAVGAIEFNGMITRQNDFQNIKTSEDQKPIIDNMNNQVSLEKKVEASNTQVHDKNETDFSNDANQNKNEYSGDGGRNRKKNKDGTVIKKSVRSFDVKI